KADAFAERALGCTFGCRLSKTVRGRRALIVDAIRPLGGGLGRRLTQMAVLKAEVFDCIVRMTLAGRGLGAGRRFTPGRRVMDDASIPMRTSIAGERPWLSIVKRRRPSSRK